MLTPCVVTALHNDVGAGNDYDLDFLLSSRLLLLWRLRCSDLCSAVNGSGAERNVRRP